MSFKSSDKEIAKIRRLYADLLNYSSANIFEEIDPLNYTNPEGDSLLHIAAMRGDVVTVAALLDAGVDPNLVGDMGNTPLHYACGQPNKEVISKLIERGARTDIKNEFGSFPRP